MLPRFLNNLSLRWKFMLAPALATLFTMLVTGLFFSTTEKQREKFSEIQQETIDKTQLLSQLATRLANNHAQIYELLKHASNGGDEARLYEMGKPLLHNIHRIEKDTITTTKNIASTESVLTSITYYRKKIITAVEMSTVDLSLAYQFMSQATIQFNKTNSQFLKLSKSMHQNLENQLINSEKVATRTLQKYLFLFFIVSLSIIIISYFLAKLLSRKLHESIQTLNKLTLNKSSVSSNSEVTQLLQVIAQVHINYNKLEETQKELSKNEYYLRSILNNMIDAVITFDETGSILSFNNSAEKIFFYTQNEIIGKKINLLLLQDESKQQSFNIQKHLESNIEVLANIDREVLALRKNKGTFPIHLALAILPDKIADKKCFILSCRDISKGKQQDEQLRRSQKMDALGKLTGGIAHDFNNLLGVIIGYSQLLADKLHDQPNMLSYAEEILGAGERGAKLTHKLLSFSRYKESISEVSEVNSILLQQQHLLEKMLTARIKLILELEDELWPIKVDSSDLGDSILNLCINAMHAMEEGGQVTIQTENHTERQHSESLLKLTPGDYVLLNVIDTGHGMDKETLSKIFDPFFTTKGELGTGLGLSQVYGFIGRSDAQIRVYSEPDQGTRFSLYFPRFDKDTGIADLVTNKEKNVTYEGNETILTVDDEPALLALSSNILQQHGYTVIKAESATRALEILESESVDLLLSDIIMPDMDGYQLATAVQEKHPRIKILLTSGFSDNRHLKMIDKKLHNNLLHKPYSADTLLKKVRELLTA